MHSKSIVFNLLLSALLLTGANALAQDPQGQGQNGAAADVPTEDATKDAQSPAQLLPPPNSSQASDTQSKAIDNQTTSSFDQDAAKQGELEKLFTSSLLVFQQQDIENARRAKLDQPNQARVEANAGLLAQTRSGLSFRTGMDAIISKSVISSSDDPIHDETHDIFNPELHILGDIALGSTGKEVTDTPVPGSTKTFGIVPRFQLKADVSGNVPAIGKALRLPSTIETRPIFGAGFDRNVALGRKGQGDINAGIEFRYHDADNDPFSVRVTPMTSAGIGLSEDQIIPFLQVAAKGGIRVFYAFDKAAKRHRIFLWADINLAAGAVQAGFDGKLSGGYAFYPKNNSWFKNVNVRGYGGGAVLKDLVPGLHKFAEVGVLVAVTGDSSKK